jgi:pilus assembly protein CpaC
MRAPQVITAAFAAIALTFVSTNAFAQEERADWLDIELGKSMVIETPRTPTAIAVTDPTVANPMTMANANQLQIQGISIGTTDLVIQFGPGIPPLIYEVTVHRDLSDLVRRIDSIVEGEPPRVYPLQERIVVEGAVQDLDTLEQVALVARLFDPDFVNLMSVQGDHQVQLEVLFAEVSRTGLRELGFNVLGTKGLNAASMTGPDNNPGNFYQIAALQDVTNNGIVNAPGAGGYTIGALATLGGGLQIAGMFQLLDDYKLGKILAQPTLVALSGQQAEFLAGGEIPIPAPSTGGSITIEFKKFGIQLLFIPTVLANNIIDIQVTVEISEIDYATATKITGIPVPGLLTRKAKTHLRIESGMTFAMAGMLSDTVTYARSGIPGIGRIPIIGLFFRSTRHVRNETEVVIYVTPRLVRPLAPGEVPAAPGTTENNNPSDIELFLLGVDHRPGSRTASPTGAVGLQR